MPRPRKIQPTTETTPQTPTETAVAPKVVASSVTVEQFMKSWNRLYQHFTGGILLDESKKKLVGAVLKDLSLLKE